MLAILAHSCAVVLFEQDDMQRHRQIDEVHQAVNAAGACAHNADPCHRLDSLQRLQADIFG
jgi:hypothetical protein